ncbi:2-dehydropantoate 2-reductase [Streptomyces sp. V4-01]|uniref:2-dehydropantoate 2-reductase n=1 Tax=Actinacidiphila polyblastidii TaxID=3110430 RepID=A0ABU7P9A1_9ACTN|nr:2-dehydropantoate 2-reductase [Streptomyces sp. V4-01]
MDMRVAVVGAGGVGGYFGGRLAAAGGDVMLVARGRHLEAIRANGLSIRGAAGDVTVPPGAVVPSVDAVGRADVVLVAVKLWDTEDVARQLRPLAESGAAVVSLQNGVETREALRRHLPEESLLGGVCYVSAVIEQPGVVVHRGGFQKLVFGEYDGRRSERVVELAAQWAGAGPEAEVSTDITRMIWEKFVFLVGLSAATTAVRQPIGVVRGDAGSRALLLDVMRETVAVGRARGVALDPSFADERLAFCDTLPPDMAASMHHDLTHGNRLELPWLSGAVARLGAELGVPTPRNSTVADILSPYVQGAPATAG